MRRSGRQTESSGSGSADTGIGGVLFHYPIDAPPQHVTPNPAPHHAQDFTLG